MVVADHLFSFLSKFVAEALEFFSERQDNIDVLEIKELLRRK